VLDDRALRNEAITLLLAGHETTALALGWALYLLARNPEAQQRVADEAEQVLSGRPPAAADLAKLSFTTLAFQEAMRLYPPIWIMERRAIGDDTIGGHPIPAGSSVVVSPYTMHRDARWWPEPDRFDPERFSPRRAAGRPRHAYLPFGLGPRLCIGMHFAMAEARTILPMVVRRFRLGVAPGFVAAPKASVTLRPKAGLMMTVAPR
jgi:cytochrome P450